MIRPGSKRISTTWGAAVDTLGNIQGAHDVIMDGRRIRDAENELREDDPLSNETVEPQVFLSGVRVIDATTLEVTLEKPDPEFLDKLSHLRRNFRVQRCSVGRNSS